jgi:hypothetical protein
MSFISVINSSINYYDILSEVKESYNEQNAHYCQGKTPKM